MKRNWNKKIPGKIIIWGGTGQSKLSRPIIEFYQSEVIAVFDDTPNLISPFLDIPIYNGWGQFISWLKNKSKNEIGFCIAIGNPHARIRIDLYEKLMGIGLVPVTLIHPSAVVAESATIGSGSQIMANAVVQPDAEIGKQCIINSNCYVDHEVTLKDGVELVAGAQVMGLSCIGEYSTIGAKSVILSRLTIGGDVEIGAGCIVDKNINNNLKHFNLSKRIQ